MLSAKGKKSLPFFPTYYFEILVEKVVKQYTKEPVSLSVASPSVNILENYSIVSNILYTVLLTTLFFSFINSPSPIFYI